MNELDRVSRAREARTVLDNPIFAEAVAKHHADLLARFAASNAGDVELWSDLHAELRALKGVQGVLKSFVTDGDKAASQSLRRVSG